jgi:tetratricopeptide (TPR) repeat protein
MTQDYYQQGLAKAKAGDTSGAISDFDLALIATPDWGEVYYRRGLVYFDLGDMLQAVSEYTQALKLDPRHKDCYYARALTRLTLKNFPGALEDIDRSIEFGRDYAPAYQLKAIVYRKLAKYPEAIAAYKLAASLYLNQQDPETSRQCLAEAQSLQPKPLAPTSTLTTFVRSPLISPEQFYIQTIERAEKGDLLGAIEDANWAVKTSPDDAWGYCCRGTLHLKQGDHQSALIDLNHAIKLDPQLAIAYRSRGKLRSQMGDYGGAIGDFDKSLAITPQDLFIYIARSQAHVSLNDYPAAIADLTQAIAIDPTEPAAYLQRAQTYTKLEELPQAIADYQIAVNIYFDRQDLPQYRDTLAKLQQLQRSTPKSTPPPTKNNDNPEIAALRQRLLILVSGQWPIATRLIEHAEENYPGRSEEWYLQKVIYDLEEGL